MVTQVSCMFRVVSGRGRNHVLLNFHFVPRSPTNCYLQLQYFKLIGLTNVPGYTQDRHARAGDFHGLALRLEHRLEYQSAPTIQLQNRNVLQKAVNLASLGKRSQTFP